MIKLREIHRKLKAAKTDLAWVENQLSKSMPPLTQETRELRGLLSRVAQRLHAALISLETTDPTMTAAESIEAEIHHRDQAQVSRESADK